MIVNVWAVVFVLLLLWGLGLITSYTLGGFIHLLLVVAVVIFIVSLIRGRHSVS